MMTGAAKHGGRWRAGRIVQVASLSDVLDTVYSEPTILLAQRVSGEEEIPEGVVAVITPDAPDILSHSSVRARNMKVLLATCHDAEPLEELHAAVGQMMSFKTTAAGSVTWGLAEAGEAHGTGVNGAGARPKLNISIPKWCVRVGGCLLSS
jgi:alpha-glucan, water dikinase